MCLLHHESDVTTHFINHVIQINGFFVFFLYTYNFFRAYDGEMKFIRHRVNNIWNNVLKVSSKNTLEVTGFK